MSAGRYGTWRMGRFLISNTVVMRSVFIVLVALVGVGCVTRGRNVTSYYVLEFDEAALDRVVELETDADSDSTAARGQGGTLGSGAASAVIVEEAEVASMFDRRQLLQRREGPVVRYLSSHLWAVSPSRAVGEFVREGVEHLGFFEEVAFGRRNGARYEVKTRIDSLTHYCCEGAVSGEVAGAFVLVEAESGDELLRHEFSRRAELADEELRTFVEAVTEGLSEELALFLAEIPSVVTQAQAVSQTRAVLSDPGDLASPGRFERRG